MKGSLKFQCTISTISQPQNWKEFGKKSAKQHECILDCAGGVTSNMIPFSTTEQYGFRTSIDEKYHPVLRGTNAREL